MKKRMLFAALLCLLLLFAGCSVTVDGQSYADEALSSAMSAVEGGDFPAFQSLLVPDLQATDGLEESFTQLCDYYGVHEGYTAECASLKANASRDVAIVDASYTLTTAEGPVFLATLRYMKGEQTGLISFYLSSEADHLAATTSTGGIDSLKGASFLQYALLALNVVFIAFILWVCIDALKNKVHLSWLWILLAVLLYFSLSVSAGGVYFNFNLLPRQYTRLLIYMDGHSEFYLALPLGAFVYLFFRKSMTEKSRLRREAQAAAKARKAAAAEEEKAKQEAPAPEAPDENREQRLS